MNSGPHFGAPKMFGTRVAKVSREREERERRMRSAKALGRIHMLNSSSRFLVGTGY